MKHVALLIAGGLLAFAAIASLLLYLMPEPREALDYFLVGSVATLGGLAAIFIGMVATNPKRKNFFFSRRKKQP